MISSISFWLQQFTDLPNAPIVWDPAIVMVVSVNTFAKQSVESDMSTAKNSNGTFDVVLWLLGIGEDERHA